MNKISEYIKNNQNEIINATKSIEDDKINRTVRYRAPKIIFYEPKDENIEGLLYPGTMTLFLAKSGSSILNEVSDSFGSGNIEKIKSLSERISSDLKERERLSIDKAVDELKSGILVDLLYDSKTLIQNLGLPERIEFVICPFAYNGGEIDQTKFELEEWYHNEENESQTKLDAVLVIRSPILTPAEKEALRMVPKDKIHFNIGSPELAAAIGAVFAGATVALAATLAVTVFALAPPMDDFIGSLRSSKMTEKEIKSLGPIASARQLTTYRGKILGDMF